MRHSIGRRVRPVLVVVLLAASVRAVAAGEEVRSMPTRKGVTQGCPLIQGGSPPCSEPCEALAQHGYIEIEPQVVDAIVQWIRTLHAG